jgi:CheY-like chemotaxis protein
MKPLVLLVDDDEDFLHIARRALKRDPVEADVRLLPGGTEALSELGLDGRAAAAGPPENLVALFVDLDMPSVNGWEVLERVRADARTRNLPVVVVSSSTRTDDVNRSYELGANSYVVKQIDPEGPGRYLTRAIRYWAVVNRAAGTAAGGRA